MDETIITTSALQTGLIGTKIVDKLTSERVIALKGDLGSGKTTFSQGLARALGVTQKVTSPTFLIIKSYNTAHKKFKTLNHIDAYRLSSENDLKTLGIKELLADNDALTLIEWPEKLGSLLKADLELGFKFINEDTREIKIQKYE